MSVAETKPHRPNFLRALRKLIGAEWVAGIFGLWLFVSCVSVASFMMGTTWILGGGLSDILTRGGTVFLGGDVAVTTTNVPLSDSMRRDLAQLGRLSEVSELRSSATIGGTRVPVEVKGVDEAYPLYGRVLLQSGRDFDTVFNGADADPAVIVEPSLLARTGASVGDRLRLGDRDFVIADVLAREPDRLSAGRFMIGPRVMIDRAVLHGGDLVQRGSLVEYRYRLSRTAASPDDLAEAVRALQPDSGWEFETSADAGDRVLQTVNRTTTFLGIAGVVAFAIGLSGAWAAANTWIRRRSRTIALYRLSGASPGLVLALHAAIVALASAGGLAIGLGVSVAVAAPLLDTVTSRLHVDWFAADLLRQLATVAVILVLGLIGTSLTALSGAARISPGAAMRSGDAPPQTHAGHVAAGAGFLLLAVGAAAFSLPIPSLAGLATIGFLAAMAVLAGAAACLSAVIARKAPKSFFGTVLCQNLGNVGHTATRTVAIGVGIVGITAIVSAQSSLNDALIQEIPERVPDLVLIDVQPAQIDGVRERIGQDTALGGVQANPFMRMTIRSVNGVPAAEALQRPDKSWVIEGDRSFSWAAEPTGAELLQGSWWDADYAGPPLISPEEDVMEAFDLKVGDTMTYGVLGRTFTSEVANIRKEYHRTFRPEYLMIASPEPFRNAPHTWIVSLQGSTDSAIDALIGDLSATYPNVTAIDIRRLVAQVRGVIDGATLASFMMAALLVVAGALSVAALVAADVDARRREALVFSIVGASRREIALVRLTEAATLGTVAAILGGGGGALIGYFVVTEGLHVSWSPGVAVLLLPVALGVASSLVAGIVGGLGAAPKGRGQMVRQLTA
ncbi:MAG: FtsX-like permease family protein [Alphaproteobacteria bacterium]